MSVYGMGSSYGGTKEMLSQFVESGTACIGWGPESAPTFHAMLRSITPGDLVFLKSFPVSHGLYIKAVGIVQSSMVVESPLGYGRKVLWLWSADNKSDYVKIGRLGDKYDQMRGGTIYPELNEDVLKVLLGLITEDR